METIHFATRAGSGSVPDSVVRTGALSRIRITPRSIQVTLGLIWLLDGLLQLQPYMFSNNFLGQMVTSMASGQPGIIQQTITWAVQLAKPYRVEFNALFALIQLVIGLGLIASRRTVKPALVLSFLWTFVVWWFGEGLGMLAMGASSPLTGAPGPVLIYSLIGLLVWPTNKPATISAASAGPIGDYWARASWAALWLLFALLMLQPVNRAADYFSSTFSTAAGSSQGPFISLNNALATAFAGRGTVAAIVLVIVMVAIGIAVFLNWHRNLFLVLGSVFGIAIWVSAEYFGGMFTGSGTDPNSGPIIVLLAATIYATRSRNAVGPASG